MKKRNIIIAIVAGSLVLSLGLYTLVAISSYFNRARSASSPVVAHHVKAEETAAAMDDSYVNYAAGEECDYAYDVEDLGAEYMEDEVGNITNLSEDPSATYATDRMLIRTVSCTMETQNFDSVVSSIQNATSSLGGYYENANISGTGNNNSYRTAYLTIRIPADKLDELTESISGLATITYSSESCEDVTINYIDTAARIDSLRVEQETLNNLLSEATDLETIIILQNELTSVRYEIETYERTLRALSDQVTYATLNINVIEVIEEPEVIEIEEVREQTFSEKIKEAFSTSLENLKEDSKDNFVSFVALVPYLAVALVKLLIFAGVIALIVAIIKKVIKKKSLKKQAKMDKKVVEEKTTASEDSSNK